MRKFYTFLFALLTICGLAQAQVTVTPTDVSGESDGISFSTQKNNGSTNPTIASAKDLRVYAKGSITITSKVGKMTSIVFNLSAQGKKRLAPITSDNGTIAAQALGDNSVVWTGESEEVTFTVGDNATYGTESDKPGQFCFTSFDVYFDGETPDIPDPQPTIDWTSSLEAPLTVAQALEKGRQLSGGDQSNVQVYVKGIVTRITEIDTQNKDGVPYGNASYYISDDGKEANELYVYRGKGLNGNNISSADIKVGDEVIVLGFIKNFVSEEASMIEFTNNNVLAAINGQGTPAEEETIYTKIADVKAAATTEKVNAAFQATNLLVTYVNGKSVYVFDGADGLLLFADNAKLTEGIKAGDKITAKFSGQLYLYSGLTEIAFGEVADLTVNSSNNAVEPQKVKIADVKNTPKDYENELVQFEELYPEAEALASRNIVFKDNSNNEVTIRDNWNVLTNVAFATESEYAVTGFVAIYNDAIQIYPRTAEDIDSGEEQVPYEAEGNGSLENPYTIADVKALNGTIAASEYVWVAGYIVGSTKSNMNQSSIIFETGENAQNTNILIAFSASDTESSNMIPVQLQAGDIRSNLNLKDNADNLGKKVWLYGTIENYFSVAGVKNVTKYSMDGNKVFPDDNDNTPDDPIVSKTIAEIIAAGVADVAQTTGTVMAAYDRGFVIGDGTGYIFVFNENTTAVGDVVTVQGKITEYGGCFQFSEVTITAANPSTPNYPEVREIDGAALDALVAKPAVTYVKVSGQLLVSGNFRNLKVEGATAQGSILASSEVLGDVANNDMIEVTGFFVYQTSSGKYGNIIATKVEKIEGEVPVVEIPEYTELAAIKKDIQAGKTDNIKFTFSGLSVLSVYNKNVYVSDGISGICFYANNSKSLKAGDIISGSVEGTLATYSGLEEISISDDYANVTVDSENNEFQPLEIGLDEISTADASAYQSLLITVKGVVFQAENMTSKSVTIKDEDEIEFTIYDSFGTLSALTFDTKASYEVTGIVTYHDGYQLAPRTAEDIVKMSEAELQTPVSAWSVESVKTTLNGSVDAIFTTDSDGEITYTSNNQAVVTVDANGVITVVGIGTATVTAETAATATFRSSTATLKITVTSGADGTLENPFTVADVLAFDAQSTSENVVEDAWVKGYIVGFVNGSAMTGKEGSNVVFSAEDALTSNIVIADAADETIVLTPVALTNNSDARNDLNLANNPENIGKVVWVKGNIRKYMGVTGVRDVTDYSLDGKTIVAVRSIEAKTEANTVIYNLAGQRVGKAVRGLYIVNGKKVTVK